VARCLGILALVRSLLLAAQFIPGEGAPPGPRTGMIVGQVLDASTGAPVAEAIVRLSMPKYLDSLPTTPKGRVMADDEGRFFFTDLPPGDYFLQASKDGFAPGTFGQRRAWGQSQLVSLGEHERLTDITLRVWKYGVIAGTVVDEAGEPVVGVAVRALIKTVVGGQTRYGNADVIPELVPAAMTDDRGMFRLSQLVPGTYVVVVPSTQTTLPMAGLGQQDTALGNDLFFAGVTELAQPGQPRAQQVGDVALLTASRVLIPPPPSPSGRMAMYRTTYYPAATTAGAATPIAIEGGVERTNLAIALQPVPAVRVSGRLIAPDGSAPPPMAIRLVGEAMAGVITSTAPSIGFETVSGMTDAAGRFTLLGVPAGEYTLGHANPFLSRALQQGTPAYWVAQPLTVGLEDISDLTVPLRPALRVEGRIEFRSSNGQRPPPAIAGLMFETPFGEPGQFAVQATKGATPSFTTIAAGGRYLVRPYELDGWFVQSITAAGVDITDRVFTLQADATSLVVTFTDRPSRVSGSVRDARGAVSSTAIVVAFPADRRLWTGYGTSPRTLKSALTTRSGDYTFNHLPPGDYYVIAIDPAEADDWTDPARLEGLAAEATKLTVTAGQNSTAIDLRLKAIR
jgi:hypothetical protein